MSDLKLLKAEEEIPPLESGHGAVSGHLSSFAMGRYRFDRSG